MEGEGVDMSGSQVVYSICMVMVEPGELFGEYFDWQELKLKGEGHCFAFVVVTV